MRQARRVSLFEREIRVRLSPAAVEILMGASGVLSEGQISGDYYYGSTMITADLARVSDQVSEECDVATARDLEALLAADTMIRDQAHSLGIAEAARLSGRALGAPQVDLRVRRNGRHFYLDVDVEARVEAQIQEMS